MAASVFPDERYPAQRSWAERAYPNLIYYKKHDKGGHFAAWEQPQLLSQDVRAIAAVASAIGIATPCAPGRPSS